MRSCRWCGHNIELVAFFGYGAYWCLADGGSRGPRVDGAAICRAHEMATRSNEPDGISDDHEPADLDLPASLDPDVVTKWLADV